MTVSLFSRGSRAGRGYLSMGIVLVGSLMLPYLVKTACSYKAAAGVAERQLADSQRQLAQEVEARAHLERWHDIRTQWGSLAERADALQ